MGGGLLDGVRVIDLTNSIAWDCGRMLASFGAEVVRVDTAQAMEALSEDPERFNAWELGQHGKTLVSLDYETPLGRDALLDLVDAGDILVESFAPGQMAALRLDYETLATRRPALIQVSITPFGQAGPHSAFAGGELVVSAMSSLLELNGDRDRAPVREPQAAHLFHACAAGLTAAVFALRERERSGRGQWIDISAQEVGASRNTAWILAAQFDGRGMTRNGPYLNLGRTDGGNRTLWRLKDGYVAWQLSAPQSPQVKAFAGWMDELGAPRPPDQSITGPAWSPDSKIAWEVAIKSFLAERTRVEIMTEGHRRGCDAAAVNTPADVIGDPHFEARGLFGPPDPALEGAPRLPRYFIRTGSDTEAPATTPQLASAT